MKKFVVALVVVVLVVAQVAQAAQYFNFGYVIEICEDVVTVVDEQGEVWEFDGSEGWDLGDLVVMQMSDNFTPNYMEDDVIANYGHPAVTVG